MRSPAARLTVAAAAWLALACAAVFLLRSERQLSDQRAASREFDQKVREAVDAVGELRAAQQAYVAAGQGVAFWMPKVASTLDAVNGAINGLRQMASSPGARSAIDDTSASLGEFGSADKRARDYLKSGEQLMAGDVIFAEGGEAAATAARQLESARLAEHQAVDAAEVSQRQVEAMVLGAAGGVAALMILALLPAKGREIAGPHAASIQPTTQEQTQPERGIVPAVVATARPAGGVPALRAAAELCTEFGRVQGVDQLTRLLGRAAEMIDAAGLVVWMGDASGGNLRAVLAHGYAPQVLSRMPTVSRSDNNAAAAAYRTGQIQIVVSRPGASGAVVAPMLSHEGCIGALTAEIRSGGEASNSVQALATIFAAQLVNVLAVPAAQQAATPSKLASG